MENNVIFDRLASGLALYVENYSIVNSTSKFKLEPSYPVDYEIESIEELQKYTDVDNYWLHLIANCNSINELPEYLKKLVIQYLPRFFKEYPQYEDAECLKVDDIK